MDINIPGPSFDEMVKETAEAIGINIVSDDGEGFYTKKEWAKMWNTSYTTARVKISQAVEDGKMEQCRVYRMRAGVPYPTAAFRLKKDSDDGD